MKRIARGQGVPTERHFSFEKTSHLGDSREIMMILLFRPQVKQAGRGFLQHFLASVFSPPYAEFSFLVPPPTLFCLGERTCTLWSLKVMCVLGTSLKHVPRQASSKAGWWAKTPLEQTCCQFPEGLVMPRLSASTTIFQGHSFCSLLLIKSVFDRGLFVIKFKRFILLMSQLI